VSPASPAAGLTPVAVCHIMAIMLAVAVRPCVRVSRCILSAILPSSALVVFVLDIELFVVCHLVCRFDHICSQANLILSRSTYVTMKRPGWV